MTLDDAIDYAQTCEGWCSIEHQQLFDWLTELRTLRAERNQVVSKFLNNAIEEWNSRKERFSLHDVGRSMFQIDKIPDGALPIYNTFPEEAKDEPT